MSTALKVVERPLSMTRASLDISHDDCIVKELAKRLNQNLNLWLPNESVEDGCIRAYFKIREKMANKDFKDLLSDLEQNVPRATMYVGPPEQNYTMFGIEFKDSPVYEILKIDGVAINNYVGTATKERLTLTLVSDEPFKAITPILISTKVNLISLDKEEMEDAYPRRILNEEERTLLNLLKERGFFSLPTREITLKELSKELRISDSKLSLDIRRISSKIFSEYLRETIKGSI